VISLGRHRATESPAGGRPVDSLFGSAFAPCNQFKQNVLRLTFCYVQNGFENFNPLFPRQSHAINSVALIIPELARTSIPP